MHPRVEQFSSPVCIPCSKHGQYEQQGAELDRDVADTMPELICFDAALGEEGLELLGETLRADCAAVATVFVLAEALIEAEDAIVEDTTAGCAAVATAAYVFFEAKDVAVAAAFLLHLLLINCSHSVPDIISCYRKPCTMLLNLIRLSNVQSMGN